MPSNRRTDFTAFVLDLMDFIEEKIRESIDDESSRPAAVGEAGGAVPLLRDRLREDEDMLTRFMLVLDVRLLEPQATPWWSEFSEMDRAEFEERAADLVRRLDALRATIGTNDPNGR
jgi:hypothetical protein